MKENRFNCTFAYYIHCFAHRLQLVLVVASREVKPIHIFFKKLIFIVNVLYHYEGNPGEPVFNTQLEKSDEVVNANLHIPNNVANLQAIDSQLNVMEHGKLQVVHEVSDSEQISESIPVYTLLADLFNKEHRDSGVTLKNAFDILDESEDLSDGEALDGDVITRMVSSSTSVIETFGNKTSVKPVRVISVLDSVLKERTIREERASEFKSSNTDTLLLSLDSGRHLSPPLVNDVIDVPSTSTLVTSLPGLGSTLPHCAITTYHTSLIADKLPVLEPVHAATVCSSAAQRSVDILQKFWGDYTNGEHDSSLVCPTGTKNKKEKKQKNRQVSPKSTSSEHIQTRSKNCVVKSNPKYL